MQFKYPLFKVIVPEEVISSLQQVLASGWIAEGERVKEFEGKLGDYIANPLTLATNSCTSGLMLALRLCGIGPGDEVISTPVTAPATNLPILDVGAQIAWADCDPRTGNISPESIESRISGRTKAIMMVHWGGVPADLDRIGEIAQKHQLFVIEDAAHALGSQYKGRPIGKHSDFVVFSFQAVKLMTTGDGGAISFKDEELFARARRMRWFGIDRERDNRLRRIDQVDIREVGLKFHMNDIAATIGLSQFGGLNEMISARRRAADIYFEQLKGTPGLALLSITDDCNPSWWVYTILVDEREAFIDKLISAGIQATPISPRNDHLAVMQNHTNHHALPNVDYFAERMVCIPNGHWLSDQDLDFIVRTIRSGW